jgi:hypothetical protein
MTQVSLHPKVTTDALCACYNDKLYLKVSWGVTHATALHPKVIALALVCAILENTVLVYGWGMT